MLGTQQLGAVIIRCSLQITPIQKSKSFTLHLNCYGITSELFPVWIHALPLSVYTWHLNIKLLVAGALSFLEALLIVQGQIVYTLQETMAQRLLLPHDLPDETGIGQPWCPDHPRCGAEKKPIICSMPVCKIRFFRWEGSAQSDFLETRCRQMFCMTVVGIPLARIC